MNGKFEKIELEESNLEHVSGGGWIPSADQYAAMGNCIGQMIVNLITKFTPVMPSVNAMNVLSLMQERIEDFINRNTEGYNFKTTALTLVGVDVKGFDEALTEEVMKRLGK